MSIIGSNIKDWENIDTQANEESFQKLLDSLDVNINHIKKGGGEIAIEKQHKKGRLTARERVDYLKDSNTKSLELGVFAGYEMYEEYGGCPSAGVIVKIGYISNN